MPKTKRKANVKSVKVSKFPWAYVDALQGKLELIKTINIFRVEQRQKLPFVPQHEEDFVSSEKHVEVIKTSSGTKSRTIYIKLLAGKLFRNHLQKLCSLYYIFKHFAVSESAAEAALAKKRISFLPKKAKEDIANHLSVDSSSSVSMHLLVVGLKVNQVVVSFLEFVGSDTSMILSSFILLLVYKHNF